jgi:hypothetical protein
MRIQWIAAVVLVVTGIGCSNEKLPRLTVLQDLRVLALIADVPEVNFDGTTFTPSSLQMTPVVADVYGNGRALSYSVYFCVDPGIGQGITPTCVGNTTRTEVVNAAAVAPTATFLAPNYVGSLAGENVDFTTMNAAALAGTQAFFASKSSNQQFNGIAMLVFFEIWPSSDVSKKITTFKRIIFSSAAKSVKNSNPTGLEIQLNGAEIVGLPTVETQLSAVLPDSSSEAYSLYDSDGGFRNVREALTIGWYLTGPADITCSLKKDCTTDGLFQLGLSNVSELNRFFPPKVAIPTARGRVLIAIAQDGRGGAMLKRYCSGAACP